MPKSFINLKIGKKTDSPLPLLDEITLSKYHASKAYKAAFAYNINMDVKSEYL